MKVDKLRAGIAIMTSFLYCFPFLLKEWTNVYLLRKNVPFLDSVLSLYDDFAISSIGFIIYLPMIIVGFTEGGTTMTVWVYSIFVISTLGIYFILLNVTRNKRLKNETKN